MWKFSKEKDTPEKNRMNELHIRIAEVLIECARQQQTITYEDLCQAIHYPALRAVGKELGKLSEFTHDKYGIFISVLVVTKETQNTSNPTPGSGFYLAYADVCGTSDNPDMEKITIEQREKAFHQDWSNLI